MLNLRKFKKIEKMDRISNTWKGKEINKAMPILMFGDH